MATTPMKRASVRIRNAKKLALVDRKAAVGSVPVSGLGDVTVATASVQPEQDSPVLVDLVGFDFSVLTPTLVLIHPRQDPSTTETNLPNQYATQVISTDSSSVQVLVTRIDPDAEGQGWDQNIELDIFVVE